MKYLLEATYPDRDSDWEVWTYNENGAELDDVYPTRTSAEQEMRSALAERGITAEVVPAEILVPIPGIDRNAIVDLKTKTTDTADPVCPSCGEPTDPDDFMDSDITGEKICQDCWDDE